MDLYFAAHFSDMVKDGHETLSIGNVLHKAIIEVDEKGSKAAMNTTASLGSNPLAQSKTNGYLIDHFCMLSWTKTMRFFFHGKSH